MADLDFMGYKRVILKSDQEPSTVALCDVVKNVYHDAMLITHEDLKDEFVHVAFRIADIEGKQDLVRGHCWSAQVEPSLAKNSFCFLARLALPGAKEFLGRAVDVRIPSNQAMA